MKNPEDRLKKFADDNKIREKGKLSFVVQFTRLAQNKSFPLNPNEFKTEQGGQVAGLGGANLKTILLENGITQQLSAEGGRTSRGNMKLMNNYVDFLNTWNEEEKVDFPVIDQYWIGQVKMYFLKKPLTLTANTSKTIRANLDTLFEQVKKREKEDKGSNYLGTVLQQLVAAKLDLIMPKGSFQVFRTSVADAQTQRKGDIVINRTAIHCTTDPKPPLLEKCQENINNNYHPMIITIPCYVQYALDLAKEKGIGGQVEVLDIQQFIASNIYEHSFFDESKRNLSIKDIIERYNKIIITVEKDPSLQIDFVAT